MKRLILLIAVVCRSLPALALSPENFKAHEEFFELKSFNMDAQSRLCETIGLKSSVAPFDIYFPIKASWMRAAGNRYLGLGSCYQSNLAEVKVLFRFLADSKVDTSYSPLIFRNEADGNRDCTESSFVKSPAGEIFVSLNCDLTPTSSGDPRSQKTIFKLDAFGSLDRKFGQNGKLVPAEFVTPPYTVNKPGFLQDGTVLDQYCVDGEGQSCTLFNFSATDGRVLGRNTKETPNRIDLSYNFESLSDGILREAPQSVSYGIWSFKDFLSRRTLNDPRINAGTYMSEFVFGDGILALISDAEEPKSGPSLDYVRFDRTWSGFAWKPDLSGRVRRFAMNDQFEPGVEVIIDLNVSTSEKVPPQDPANSVECRPNGKFGEGILVSCLEYDPGHQPVRMMLAAFDRNMRLNRSFGTDGLFYPQAVKSSCLSNGLPRIEVTNEYLKYECDESEYPGDGIRYVRRIYFFE